VRQRGGALKEEFRPLLPWILVMSKSEALEFHEREAARYRRLLANITTPALKTRLAQQAKDHERLAKELSDEQVLADA
jgi:hypothetical protein